MASPIARCQKIITEAADSHPEYMRTLWKRSLFFAAAISCMASSTSLLRLSLFGNDPYSCINLGYSLLTGLSFGTCVSIFNILLFIPMLICGRRYLRIGTFIYLVLLGPVSDLSYGAFAPYLAVPFDSIVPRAALLLGGMAISCFGVSLYMCLDFGMGPYDAASCIINDMTQGRLPFRYARILLDSTSVIIGFLLGSLVGIGTVIMALGMGPLINFFNQHVNTPLLRRNGLQ